MLVVLTTTPDADEAESLARRIIEAKLAVCVQILPGVTSFYYWKDAVQKHAEFLLLIKTLAENYPDLEEFIRSNHSYEVPEIVAIRAQNVSDNYLMWIRDYCSSGQ